MPWLPRPKKTRPEELEEFAPLLRKRLTHPRGWHPLPRRPRTEEEEPRAQQRRPKFAAWYLKTFVTALCGRHRVANDALEGYVVYVGRGAMPDFTTAPAGFGIGLPVAFAVTPPGVGTLQLWVVTRRRNKYGLESQNTHPQLITIDTTGNEVLGPISSPVLGSILLVENEKFLVYLSYPGLRTDPHPADTWRLYVKQSGPPNPGVDVPTFQGAITGDQAGVQVGPYPTGGVSYWFILTVVRSLDGLESDTPTPFVFALPADPVVPVPLPGVFVSDIKGED